MIVCGIYVGEVKPKMNTYLKPFAVYMSRLKASGGVKWTDPRNGAVRSSEVVCPVLSADAPATAAALNEMELNLTLEPRKRIRRVRRFLYEDFHVPLRTGYRMEKQAEQAEARRKSRKGVVGTSVLSSMPEVDRAVCVCAEYLHQVCLGVTKYFLNLMFFEKGPWYVGDNLEHINMFLLSIRVPDFVKRRPRGMDKFSYLIGSEFRSLLLFYSLPALQAYLPDRYFQHWLVLVEAIYLLLQDSISEVDLKAAEILLRLFVRDINELYGPKYYTYNVHSLLHLPLLVERWGLLWATSSFCFEKFNHFIITHIHGTKHVGKELLNNVKIIQSVQVFENVIEARKLCVNPGMRDVMVCSKVLSNDCLPDGGEMIISDAGITSYKLYSRVKIEGVLYSSRCYDASKKRANSFVQSKPIDAAHTMTYGEVLCYLCDCDTNSVFCLLMAYQAVHTKILFHYESRLKVQHLVPVHPSEDVILIPVSCIQNQSYQGW
ncbi:hypothetical protein ONE63_011103 [Megalurothrips usitatus]|uniref:DUF4218 domain-containing protein n=1 Tax=Megalurothrips usitatus TaxID=439358 RepID=A0AAV7XLX1_9NEOP|nr:hypothetical protein ONE63_011103 [Megalurothrips usitatus]